MLILNLSQNLFLIPNLFLIQAAELSLVLVAELSLVLVAELSLVQAAELSLVLVAVLVGEQEAEPDPPCLNP